MPFDSYNPNTFVDGRRGPLSEYETAFQDADFENEAAKAILSQEHRALRANIAREEEMSRKQEEVQQARARAEAEKARRQRIEEEQKQAREKIAADRARLLLEERERKTAAALERQHRQQLAREEAEAARSREVEIETEKRAQRTRFEAERKQLLREEEARKKHEAQERARQFREERDTAREAREARDEEERAKTVERLREAAARKRALREEEARMREEQAEMNRQAREERQRLRQEAAEQRARLQEAKRAGGAGQRTRHVRKAPTASFAPPPRDDPLAVMDAAHAGQPSEHNPVMVDNVRYYQRAFPPKKSPGEPDVKHKTSDRIPIAGVPSEVVGEKRLEKANYIEGAKGVARVIPPTLEESKDYAGLHTHDVNQSRMKAASRRGPRIDDDYIPIKDPKIEVKRKYMGEPPEPTSSTAGHRSMYLNDSQRGNTKAHIDPATRFQDDGPASFSRPDEPAAGTGVCYSKKTDPHSTQKKKAGTMNPHYDEPGRIAREEEYHGMASVEIVKPRESRRKRPEAPALNNTVTIQAKEQPARGLSRVGVPSYRKPKLGKVEVNYDAADFAGMKTRDMRTHQRIDGDRVRNVPNPHLHQPDSRRVGQKRVDVEGRREEALSRNELAAHLAKDAQEANPRLKNVKHWDLHESAAHTSSHDPRPSMQSSVNQAVDDAAQRKREVTGKIGGERRVSSRSSKAAKHRSVITPWNDVEDFEGASKIGVPWNSRNKPKLINNGEHDRAFGEKLGIREHRVVIRRERPGANVEETGHPSAGKPTGSTASQLYMSLAGSLPHKDPPPTTVAVMLGSARYGQQSNIVFG